MSTAAPTYGAVAQAPQLTRSVERLRGALLWLTGFSGAIVFMRKVVVLPQPDGPSRTRNSPSAMSSVTPATAAWSP